MLYAVVNTARAVGDKSNLKLRSYDTNSLPRHKKIGRNVKTESVHVGKCGVAYVT